MKFIVVVVVVGFVLWLMGRRRPSAPPRGRAPPLAGPLPMLRCAHCGLHLPESEAAFDVAGRAYCSAAHRIAGPR
ncbi:MAG: hypothetical protein KGL43_11920 [Burkholderiales bacterium]|nr:hypothetical protein [Burkholderiales bacterium]MDE2454290.1 hypothetical protein [Burkholderiales bacterium]